MVRERRERIGVREYPEANIENVILTEDDESWYSQAGFYMVEQAPPFNS